MSFMQTAFLPSAEEGFPLTLRMKKWNEKLFFECDRGLAFLRAIRVETPLGSGREFILRGFCSPEEGGVFELFDHFGKTLSRPIEVPFDSIRVGLLDRMLWQVDAV